MGAIYLFDIQLQDSPADLFNGNKIFEFEFGKIQLYEIKIIKKIYAQFISGIFYCSYEKKMKFLLK